jgi:hypothetical protein
LAKTNPTKTDATAPGSQFAPHDKALEYFEDRVSTVKLNIQRNTTAVKHHLSFFPKSGE